MRALLPILVLTSCQALHPDRVYTELHYTRDHRYQHGNLDANLYGATVGVSWPVGAAQATPRHIEASRHYLSYLALERRRQARAQRRPHAAEFTKCHQVEGPVDQVDPPPLSPRPTAAPAPQTPEEGSLSWWWSTVLIPIIGLAALYARKRGA